MEDSDKVAIKKSLHFFIFAYWYDPRWDKFVGATVKIWDLAKNLSALNQHVVIFLPKYHFDASGEDFRLVEVPLINFPMLRMASFNLFLIFYLARYALNATVDVVYVRRMSSIIPLLFCRLKKAKLFYEINDDPYSKKREEGSRLIFRVRCYWSTKIDEIYLKLCNKAFVISAAIKQKLINRNRAVADSKLILMPSGANTTLFRPLGKKQCCSVLNIDCNKRYIGFVGTLLKHQGLVVLIESAAKVLKDFPNVLFLIIGEGPMKKALQQKVWNQGLSDNFYFKSQVDYKDLPVWIGAMDVCVAPFLKSAGLRSPVKIFDYLASGKTVVASKIRGTTDLFEANGVLKLVEPEDPNELADAVIELLKNHQAAKEMARKGRALMVRTYNRKVLAKKIIMQAYSSDLDSSRIMKKIQ